MSMDPNARRRAQSFWKKVKDYVSDQISMQSEVMEVIEVTSENRLVVRSFDPDTDVSREVPHIKSVRAEVGSRVVVTTVGGHQLVTGVLREPGQVEDDSIPFSGSGSSDFAARADHYHKPDGASAEGMLIGNLATQTLRGMAIGYDANAADAATAIGKNANASGYVSVAAGWDAAASGERSVAAGNFARALGAFAVAVGFDSYAPTDQATSIGYTSKADGNYATTVGAQSDAIGEGAIAVGYHTYVAADRSLGIGWDCNITGARSFGIGYGAYDSGLNDFGMLRANTVRFQASNGTQSTIQLVRPDGGIYSINVNNYGDVMVNGTPLIYRNWGPNNIWTQNKQTASGGPWSFRSAPVVDSGNLIETLAAGRGLHDTGYRYYVNGYTWAFCWLTSRGFGYIVQDALVAL